MSKYRRKSALATVEIISPNKNSPRNKTVRRLTPHCVAGNLSVEATLKLAHFQAGATSPASTNYAIGTDGRIGLGVEETNRAWTTSSSANDHEAITFEIANNGGAPDWRMSDAAINAWLDLAIDICKFYGFKKVDYVAKPANIAKDQVETWIKTWAKPDEMIITLHNWYAAKACPGPYFMRQIPWLVREMNKRLGDSAYKGETFVGEGGASSSATMMAQAALAVPLPQTTAIATQTTSAFKEYLITIIASVLNVRSGPGTNYSVVRTLTNDKNTYTIVEEAHGPGAMKWGRLKSGLGWISLDFCQRK